MVSLMCVGVFACMYIILHVTGSAKRGIISFQLQLVTAHSVFSLLM